MLGYYALDYGMTDVELFLKALGQDWSLVLSTVGHVRYFGARFGC